MEAPVVIVGDGTRWHQPTTAIDHVYISRRGTKKRRHEQRRQEQREAPAGTAREQRRQEQRQQERRRRHEETLDVNLFLRLQSLTKARLRFSEGDVMSGVQNVTIRTALGSEY